MYNRKYPTREMNKIANIQPRKYPTREMNKIANVHIPQEKLARLRMSNLEKVMNKLRVLASIN